MAAGEYRFLQLARILDLPRDSDASVLIAAARERAPDVGAAFFAEAADSDDVTGPESAREYLAARLALFDDVFDAATINAMRAEFERRLLDWLPGAP